MAAILSKKHPTKAPELFVYSRRIFHAARNYEGHTWVAYDRVYRGQADQALYNEAFAGRVKLSVRCKHCHAMKTCPDLLVLPFALSLMR